MRIIAALLLAVVLAAFGAPVLAADQPADVKALKEQVKSLQDANVVMKEDLAKTQLETAEMAAQHQAKAEADKQALGNLQKQLDEIRQSLADERAAHQAALDKAKAEAARQRSRARHRQTLLYILGGLFLLAAGS